MQGAKVADLLGALPGNALEQADATQAYTQALLKGTATWCRLPRERWPAHWPKDIKDPVVPLKLALCGHPQAGAFWENMQKHT
jgi:hypothetical protein